jgi:hypothetical protein
MLSSSELTYYDSKDNLWSSQNVAKGCQIRQFFHWEGGGRGTFVPTRLVTFFEDDRFLYNPSFLCCAVLLILTMRSAAWRAYSHAREY